MVSKYRRLAPAQRQSRSLKVGMEKNRKGGARHSRQVKGKRPFRLQLVKQEQRILVINIVLYSRLTTLTPQVSFFIKLILFRISILPIGLLK